MCRVWDVKAAIKVGLRYIAHILKIIDCNQLQDPQLLIWSPVWVKVWMTSRNGIWRRDWAPTRFLFRVRQDVWLQVCRLRKLLVATLRNNNVHLPDYYFAAGSIPRRGRRRGDLQYECARVSSSWSRARISFRSPRKCTGTVSPPCEQVGGVSVYCSPQKPFHIRRKHVPCIMMRYYMKYQSTRTSFQNKKNGWKLFLNRRKSIFSTLFLIPGAVCVKVLSHSTVVSEHLKDGLERDSN